MILIISTLQIPLWVIQFLYNIIEAVQMLRYSKYVKLFYARFND